VQKHLPFVKMSGAGNDFILLSVRDLPDVDPGWLAERLCARAMSIGADGLIIVTPAENNGVRIRFYNPDGSLAEMCGNGSRCAARFALDNRFVTETSFTLLTDSGDLPVRVEENGCYRVVMPAPAELELDYMDYGDDDLYLTVHSVRVGVPHCVAEVEGLDDISDDRLIKIGRSLRHHEKFPVGVNVNFIEQRDDGTVRQRTYERGVENLTKACGTGATAIAHVLLALEEQESPVELVVDGGRLTIAVEDEQYWLAGNARLIATGIISPEAVDWKA
jgi:diaminopimelate epimerase